MNYEASNITSLNQLQGYAKGQIVEMPPFAEGQPFIAQIKRPSMLAMMKSGKIPNSLLISANSLFAGTAHEDKNRNVDIYKDIFSVTEVIAKACLISPSYEEVEKAGLQLTDDQMMFIFNYTQTGVKALDSFRQQQEDSQPTDDQQPSQGTAE